MARFEGNFDARLDEKGRVFFPAAFRRILQLEGDESLVVRKDVYQRCLVLYPRSAWDSRIDDMRSRLNPWNAHEQMVFRKFEAGVDDLPIDSTGRILIKKEQQQQIGLQSLNVHFIGMRDVIELWAKDDYDSLHTDETSLAEDLAKLFGEGTL